jgi:hypothetical protein
MSPMRYTERCGGQTDREGDRELIKKVLAAVLYIGYTPIFGIITDKSDGYPSPSAVSVSLVSRRGWVFRELSSHRFSGNLVKNMAMYNVGYDPSILRSDWKFDLVIRPRNSMFPFIFWEGSDNGR